MTANVLRFPTRERAVCTACGAKPIATACIDGIEVTKPGDTAHVFEPLPQSLRYGCEAHPVSPRLFYKDGHTETGEPVKPEPIK